jgi:hypothetical protein
MKFLVPFLLLFVLCAHARPPLPVAQTRGPITIRKAASSIRLDGLLDEAAWQDAQMETGFFRQFPVDSGFAGGQTEVRLTFDDQYLYVGAVVWQPQSDYTVQSRRRDFGPGTSDVLNILLDPTKDGLNGFKFGVSPLNIQREALIANGNNLSFEWDNKWDSRVTNYPDRWVLEVAIPFKTLRYNVSAGQNSWRVNFTRARLKNFEVSSMVPIPFVFPTNSLAFTTELVWETPPPKPGVNISIIPYITGQYNQQYQRAASNLELRNTVRDPGANIGGDVKIAITPGLNLDLTINPDFSQVEVDRQVANLSRFELFFPELRQSFLENRDLFAMFGFPGARPFFSRRIGLAYNPLSRQYERVPILAGARLSGKLNDNWRIGVLDMQTAEKTFATGNVQPGSNFGVLTAQRRLWSRSTISGILVNKQNFLKDLSPTQRAGIQPWNRVAGLEFNLYSKDNRWEGETYFHRSFSPDPAQRGNSMAQFLGYNTRRFNLFSGYSRTDSSYSAEAGFVPRPGVQEGFVGAGFVFYPSKGWAGRHLANMRLGFNADQTFSLDGQGTDRDLSVSHNFFFKDQSNLRLSVFNAYTYLFDDFDPTYLATPDEKPLDGQRGYTYNGFRGEYNSSTTYNWQTQIAITAGGYFNGQIFAANGQVLWRQQPYGSISVLYSYNQIALPRPYVSASFWLIGPRLEYAFTRTFFTSVFFQYNTQANNFNINGRVQWRFAPASDVFLVYTDNSFAEPVAQTRVRFLSPKNKSLVLKMVYWLNC